MLKNIPPILSPDLLYVLANMGHGDEIIIADGNFPADSSTDRLIRCDGHGVPEVLEAVLELPEKYRDVVYLYYYEEYTAPEIGRILGKKENTVYTLLKRARKILKDKLGGDEYEA